MNLQVLNNQHLDQMATNFASSQIAFFGQPAMLGNKRKSYNALPVRNIKLKDTLLDLCQERKDSWTHTVMARIVNVMICMQQMLFIIRVVMLILVATKKQIPTAHSNDKLGSIKLKLG